MKTFVRKHFKDEYGVEFSICGDITTLTHMPSGLKGAYRIPDFVTNIGASSIAAIYLCKIDKIAFYLANLSKKICIYQKKYFFDPFLVILDRLKISSSIFTGI